MPRSGDGMDEALLKRVEQVLLGHSEPAAASATAAPQQVVVAGGVGLMITGGTVILCGRCLPGPGPGSGGGEGGAQSE